MKPNMVIRNSWYVAGLSADFSEVTLTGHVIAKRPVVMWRSKDGRVVAYDDRCAHKRFPLSKGRLMPDGILECAYHGLCYDSAGSCVKVMLPTSSTGSLMMDFRGQTLEGSTIHLIVGRELAIEVCI